MSNINETLQKKRAELKEVFDNPADDGKYSAEQKNAINGLNTELAELVDAANLDKSKAKNEKAMETEAYAPEAPAEPIQTVMRYHNISNSYDIIKKSTRGKVIDKIEIDKIIAKSKLDKEIKEKLLKLKPRDYIGLAKKLALNKI